MYFLVWSGIVDVICCAQLSIILIIYENNLYLEQENG
jgi:hypothetical protein